MRRRLPVAGFVLLAIATVAAFFNTQRVKVATPLIAGGPRPHPGAINPVSGGVCELASGPQGVPEATSYRRMSISFYLLNRADNVDVSIVDGSGQIVATLATNRYMRVNQRVAFVWNGRRSDGQVATPGDYYVRVSLVHQGRTVQISTVGGRALPVRVATSAAPLRVTGVRADGVEPAVIPQGSGRSVAIHFLPTSRSAPTIDIYRTDVPGAPQLVDSFKARSLHTGFWNGRESGGSPAPQGTYLVGLSGHDDTCTVQTFPARLPPPAGSTPHAGVTVRYLAAEPPSTPVQVGHRATVQVDARRHRYQWALRRADAKRILSSGRSSAVQLSVSVPGGSPGLYALALRWGSHRTVVPIVAGGLAEGPGRTAGSSGVLVVVPALTWQGTNPVDDDGDGMPNTLTAGTPILLDRPYAHGLPAGFSGEAGLVNDLRVSGLSFHLTTDLSLPTNWARYSGVILAGSERWLPNSVTSGLSTYVEQGGHVLSLGLASLQRSVQVTSTTALDPSAAHAVDALQARPQRVVRAGRSIILVQRDRLHIFPRSLQAFTGWRTYQSFAVQAPASLESSAGVTAQSPAIVGYRLGKGAVVDVGLVGFGASLAHNASTQQFVAQVWKRLLSR